jgi:hypothetical protein
VRLPTDFPGDVTAPMLVDAIRNQRAIASTGPFITLTVDGGQIGDTIVPTGGTVSVAVTVDAPGWMAVDTVRVYAGGFEVRRFDILPGTRPVFSTTFTLPVSADTFIVAHASGKQPLPGDVVGEYARSMGYDMLPWAITNPVFIDYNGDGLWKPPPASQAPVGPPFGPMKPAPLPGGAPGGPAAAGPLGARQTVPVDCQPGASGVEPPLSVPPIRQLMPLLYP